MNENEKLVQEILIEKLTKKATEVAKVRAAGLWKSMDFMSKDHLISEAARDIIDDLLEGGL